MTFADLLEEHPHDARAFLNRMREIGEKVKLPDSEERAKYLATLWAQLMLIEYRDCEPDTPSSSCRRPNEHPLIQTVSA